MNQSINLLIKEDKSEQEALTAINMERILIGFAVILLISYFVSFGGRFYREYQYKSIQKELQVKLSQLDLVKIKQEDDRGKSELEQAIKDTRTEQSRKLQVLSYLRKGEIKKVRYSDFLEGMSLGSIKGVWLSKFSISQEGDFISFEGHAAADNLIPRFLENLSQQEIFKGRDFNKFVANRNEVEERLIDFKIESTRPKP